MNLDKYNIKIIFVWIMTYYYGHERKEAESMFEPIQASYKALTGIKFNAILTSHNIKLFSDNKWK